MIQRTPHRVFAALWAGWVLLQCYAALIDDDFTRWVLLGLFVVIEGVAVLLDTGSRDTLSEIATWVQRKLSKHRRPLRGWNAMLMAIILVIAYNAMALTDAWVKWPVGALIVIWLHDHWVSPDAHG